MVTRSMLKLLSWPVLFSFFMVVFLSIAPSTFAAPLNFRTMATMPVGTSAAASAVVAGKVYVLGGASGLGLTLDVYAYDPAADVWWSAMPLTEPIRNGAAADRSGIIYIAGGDALGAPRYAVTAYNTDTGASSNLGNLQEPRINASAAIIGDSLYVIGGSSDAVLASIEEFDLNSNTSSIKATLPAPRQLSSAVALGDKIYIIGGLDAAGSPTTTCWEFDPAANTFAEKASMPVACTAKSSLAANGKIYVVGGLTSVGLPPYSWSSAILEYDPAANTWKQVGGLLTSRHSLMAAVVNDTLYTIGGSLAQMYSDPLNLAVNEAASLVSSEPDLVWETKAPLPVGINRGQSGMISGRIYLLGGLSSNGITDEVQMYDPLTNTWTPQPSLYQRVLGAGVATWGDSIYLAGGDPGTGSGVTNIVQLYHPADGIVRQIGTLVTPRFRMNATILNNKLYVVGGMGENAVLDTIEEFDLATNVSVMKTILPEPRTLAGVVAVGRKLYILGGTGNSAANTCLEYDPVANAFTPISPMPIPGDVRAAFHANGKIYVVGVMSNTNPPVDNSIQEYDLATNSWRIIGYIPTPRVAQIAEFAAGKAYVVGGDNWQDPPLTVNEVWSLPDSWYVGGVDAFSSVVRWPAAQHSPVLSGSYLNIGNKFYLVTGSDYDSNGIWAQLQECNQITGEPLYDPQLPYTPLWADLTGAEGRLISVYDFWPGGGFDMTPPLVVSSNPASGAVRVGTSKIISITFSEQIDSASVTSSSFSLSGPGGTVAGAVGVVNGSSAQFVPSENLELGSTYTAMVTSEVKDMSGNLLQETYSWSFTTIGVGEVSFSPAGIYGVGTNPRYISAADFNGDGNADLAVASYSYDQSQSINEVSIMLGNGDGTFAPAVNYSPIEEPYLVKTGDFNNDGKVDLVVSSYSAVAVMLGNGDGTFASPLICGSVGGSVTTGDFNGDGRLDLAVGNQYIYVYLGNGNGTFYFTGSFDAWWGGGGSLNTTDFNGDGKADLAAINNQGMAILLGNGNGTFQPLVNYSTLNWPSSLALGDFNNDGKIDVAVSASGISIFQGNGDGTFQPERAYQPYYTNRIITGDFNNDGNADLAAVGQYGDVVTIFQGNGDGTFKDLVSYTQKLFPCALTAADFNRDGKLDLAVVNEFSNNVSLWFNNTTTAANAVPSWVYVASANSTGTFGVSWGASATVGASYVVEESKDVSFATSTQVYSGSGTFVNLAGRTNGTYYYRVKAVMSGHPDSAWQSPPNGCTVTLPCKVPAWSYVATANSTGTFGVSWGASATAGASYILEESRDDAGFANPVQVYSGSGTFVNLTGRANGTYYYRVKAIAPGYSDSAWQSPANGCTVSLPCKAPAWAYVATANSTGTYGVSWGATATAGASYILEESRDDAGFANPVQVYSGSGTFVNLTGRANGTYYYRVKATAPGYSDSAWVSPPNGCTVSLPCNAPAWVYVATANSTGTFGVSWGASATAGASYILEESRDDAGFANPVQVYSGSGTFVNLTGRANGTYYYRVKAIASGYSDSAWKSPPNGCTVTRP